MATLAHTPKDGVYNVTVSVLVTAGNQEGTIRGVVQVEVGRGCGNDLGRSCCVVTVGGGCQLKLKTFNHVHMVHDIRVSRAASKYKKKKN